jgi:hypothetical protein
MTEPKRLIDEMDSPLARELLQVGRRSPSGPLGVRRQRVLTALGIGLVVGTTKKVSFAALSTWTKVLAIGCVMGAGAGGVVAYRAFTTPPSSAPNTTSAAIRTTPEGGSHVEQGSVSRPAAAGVWSSGPTVAAPAPASATRVSTAARNIAPRTSVLKTERKDSSVREELTLLEHARAELQSGRSEAAVITLGSYTQRFPRGVLALEAEVLRIEALAAAGRTHEATKRARRVLERNPNSVVASRLKRFEQPR